MCYLNKKTKPRNKNCKRVAYFPTENNKMLKKNKLYLMLPVGLELSHTENFEYQPIF